MHIFSTSNKISDKYLFKVIIHLERKHNEHSRFKSSGGVWPNKTVYACFASVLVLVGGHSYNFDIPIHIKCYQTAIFYESNYYVQTCLKTESCVGIQMSKWGILKNANIVVICFKLFSCVWSTNNRRWKPQNITYLKPLFVHPPIACDFIC